MAKVKTFLIKPDAERFGGVPDLAVAAFITECEEKFYVRVTTTFIPLPSPRLNIIVTKLDEKERE